MQRKNAQGSVFSLSQTDKERIIQLEQYLEEAIDILSAKARPGDECLLGAWIDEAIGILHNGH